MRCQIDEHWSDFIGQKVAGLVHSLISAVAGACRTRVASGQLPARRRPRRGRGGGRHGRAVRHLRRRPAPSGRELFTAEAAPRRRQWPRPSGPPPRPAGRLDGAAFGRAAEPGPAGGDDLLHCRTGCLHRAGAGQQVRPTGRAAAA